MSVDISLNSSFENLTNIFISLITHAGALVNDMGRLGIGIINVICSVFGAQIPNVIVIANLSISTGLAFNVLVIGGAVWVVYSHFAEAFKSYVKIIGVGTGGLLLLSAVGAVL